MKFEEFKELVDQHQGDDDRKVLIFMHDYPDPDCITSAVILQKILGHFAYQVKIVYGGEIVRAENRAMVQLFDFELHPYAPGEEKGYHLTALVDTNQYIKNHHFPTDITPDFTFDHHTFKNEKPLEILFKNFYEINTSYGSCSSILMDYLFHFEVPLDEVLATAYCYTMLAETNHFERGHNEKDIVIYKKVHQLSDLEIISKILNIKKPQMFFNVMGVGLTNFQLTDRVVTSHLGKVESIEMIHQVADFLLRMEGVDLSLVTGYESNKLKKICIRSHKPEIHAGTTLKEVLDKIGQGGGHRQMAAGNFKGDEKMVAQTFIDRIKN